jgi:uncharacterized coiled-coil DUF342 family protein
MPKETYDKLIAERDALRRRVEFLGDERDQLRSMVVALRDKIDNNTL